jgi:transcriptional regulator GlxA family with amidase domain
VRGRGAARRLPGARSRDVPCHPAVPWELKTTPAGHVKQIRFDTAKDLLNAGHSVTDTAMRSGFGSGETLRSVFIQNLGLSPRAYQQRFHSAIRN